MKGVNMKKWVPFSLIGILLFACSIPSTIPTQTLAPSPEISTNTPMVAQTATDTTAPIITEPSTQPPNVNCNELGIFLDPTLANGSSCETIGEIAEGMEVYPQNTTLTLQGYVLSDKFFTPHISVYPVQRFTELLPDLVPSRVSALQNIIGNASCPSFTSSFGESLPFLPVFNAGQVFFAECQVITFGSGSGIRYLTEFAQYFAAVNNFDLFYTFQGLTSDGTYWISASLPVNHPILPINGDSPPNGLTTEEFIADYETYLSDIINQLNSQSPDSYIPTLSTLDLLVSSIIIQP
jgi:hypothetical protein